jgi:hypothetical protein
MVVGVAVVMVVDAVVVVGAVVVEITVVVVGAVVVEMTVVVVVIVVVVVGGGLGLPKEAVGIVPLGGYALILAQSMTLLPV